jgi:hypothetical protein
MFHSVTTLLTQYAITQFYAFQYNHTIITHACIAAVSNVTTNYHSLKLDI